MKLRTQLVVLGLLALVLPWAGLNYVVITEDALRENERDMLAKFASSVADFIGLQDELAAELAPVASPGSLYLHTAFDRLPVVDGYPDDDFPHQQLAVRLASDDTGGVPLQASVLVAAIGEDAVLSLQVSAAAVGVELWLGGPGRRRHLWLPLDSPGEFIARRVLDKRQIDEYRSHGAWQETANGMFLELMFPREWLDGRLGLRLESGSALLDTLDAASEPPPLVQRSERLEGALRHFSRRFAILVTDADGWVRAARLGEGPAEPGARPPGFWVIEWLYRQLGNRAFLGEPYDPPRAGRLDRPLVAAAWASGGASARYVMDNGAAVAASGIRINDRRNKPVGVVVVETSSEPLLALVATSLMRFIATAFLATVLLAFALLGYAAWLSLRISRLSREVAAVMAPDARRLGEFPAQTAVDEIGMLGRSFGELIGRVRGYTDYLQKLAARLAHEMRTPLAVVRSSLDNLEHEPLSSQGVDYLRRARAGSDRLGHILASLGEATRVEQAIHSARKEPVDLAELLQQLVAGYQSAYPEKQIRLEVAVNQCRLQACPELLAQMLDKLMDNAGDFCPPEGEIRFGLTSADGQAMLTVENDGPPLPADMQGQLFESMVSVRNGKHDKVHLGLGLTIVRLVAEFHGGAVRAESLPGGRGARFEVTLPLAAG